MSDPIPHVKETTKGFRTGHAVMTGDDPLNLEIRNTSPPKQALATPYRGRYPAGSLVHDGIWYYCTYLLGPSAGYNHQGLSWNWPNLGPLPSFHISRDLGKTWEEPTTSVAKPLFPEPAEFLGPVKMGAPHFVDYGRNMDQPPFPRPPVRPTALSTAFTPKANSCFELRSRYR